MATLLQERDVKNTYGNRTLNVRGLGSGRVTGRSNEGKERQLMGDGIKQEAPRPVVRASGAHIGCPERKEELSPHTAQARGQVTLFIIIAALIVIVGGIVVVTNTSEQTEEVLKAQLPSQAQPFYEYITACLAQTGEEGIRILGERGGYIENTFEANANDPTDGDAVLFSQGSDLKIPYWHAMKSDNLCDENCQMTSNRPPLRKPSEQSIERQLEKYINTEITACLRDFTDFMPENWKIKQQGEKTVEATVTAEGVNLHLKYPVTFERGGEEISVEEYSTLIPVKLEDLYNFATAIVDAERKYNYLERATYQLITLNQGLGQNQLPPGYDVKVSLSGGSFWMKSEVEKKVQGLLATYIPALQVFGTKNYHYIEAPAGVPDPVLFENLYNRNMLVIPGEEAFYPDLEASFIYLPWWKPYFDMNCDGELCQGERMLSTLILPIGIQRYLFTYDISYPVLVQLKDPDAFYGKGFTFQYFIEQNMRNSQPVRAESLTIDVEKTSPTMFCDYNKRTGTTLVLNVTDAATKQGVPETSIVFSCDSGNFADRCALGETSEDGSLRVQLPRCLGGSLTLNRESHGSVSYPMDSDREEERKLDVKLQPFRPINFRLMRYYLTRDMFTWWHVDQEIHPLDPDEEASITLTRKTAPGEKPFSTVGYIFGNQQLNEQQGVFKDIELLPGTYTVQINTFLAPTDPVKIMPQLRKAGKKKKFWIPTEPIVFDRKNPLPYGGAEFEFTITPEQLDKSGTMTLYTIDFMLDKLPEGLRIIEDLEQLGQVNAYSISHRGLLQPTLRSRDLPVGVQP